jgi:hypothetical protein
VPAKKLPPGRRRDWVVHVRVKAGIKAILADMREKSQSPSNSELIRKALEFYARHLGSL